MSVGWDIDGTLCHTPHGTDMDNPEELLARCTPIPAAVQAVREMAAAGHDQVLVTARGPHLRDATMQQAHAWLGSDIAQRLRLVTRPGLLWDPDRMVPDKQLALQQNGVNLYIGDLPADRAAALRAGVLFVWAWEVHAKGPAALFPLLPPLGDVLT